MTTIPRARLEFITRYMVDSMAAGPQRGKQVPLASILKRVETTAEEKAFLVKNQASSAAAAAAAAAEGFDRAYYAKAAEATYTKFGKMSTDEKEAYVQQKLAQFDVAEAHYAERLKKTEKSNVPASPPESPLL